MHKFALLLLAGFASFADAADRKPNFVCVFTDDQRLSAPRDDTARASCGNGAKRKFLL